MNRYVIIDPRNNATEVFENVRVDENVFAAWIEERDSLREIGAPDRPPDAEVDGMHAWVPRAGEEDLQWFKDHPAPEPTDPFGVYYLMWPVVDGRTDVLIHGEWDGGFHSAIRGYEGERMTFEVSRDYPKEMSPEAVWADIEERLVELAPLHDQEPRISTYTDWASMEAEVELARADIARGFTNPLYTEGTVQ